MAESKSFSDEFLSCAICYDIYTDPCTLCCGHSFCRACLTNYTKSNSEAIEANILPCACCRAATKVPRPSAPVEEWAGQICASLILKGLLHRYKRHAAVQRGKERCFLCIGIGETTQATSWCSDCKINMCSRCAKIHVKSPFAEKHEVVVFTNCDNTQIEKNMCKVHVDAEIKFFCKACNKKACSKCCSGTHSCCDNVMTIDSMTSIIKSELNEIESKLLLKTKESRNRENDQEARLEQLKTRALAIETEIKSASATAIGMVQQKESDALEKLADTYYELKGQLQAGIKSSQISVQTYRQHSEFIQQALDSENVIDLVDAYQIWKSKSSFNIMNPEAEPIVGELKLTSNIEPLKKALKHIARIGVTIPQKTKNYSESNEIIKVVQLDPLPDREKKPSPMVNPVLTAKLEETLNIRHTDDTDDPIPADVEVVSGRILVLDFNNNSLKSITKDNAIVVLKLPGCPRRMTRLSHNCMAVSADFRIFLIETNNPLSLKSTIDTIKDYWCICALAGSTLAAGSGSSIDILDLKGTVVRSLSPRNTTHLIKNPNYLSATHGGNILATDSESKSVYCLTSMGNVIFSFFPEDRVLEHPSGVVENINGDILFADWKSSKIIQLSSDGKFVRDLLTSDDDIDKPGSLSVDSDNKLYLCDGSLGNKCVKVFCMTSTVSIS